MRDPILAPHCTAGIEKNCKKIWHHANVCQNGCHRNASLWFLCDVTSMCRVFETSRKQVSFILALEVEQIDHARVNCWCCTLQYFIWPGQEWNKMDESRFNCSWLALGAWLEGCFPSCVPHMCHGLAFSVSPTGAGLCSCQLAAFEVHLPQVGAKTASNQWRFRFQAHLFDHTDPLLFSQDHADAQELRQNWQRLHFTEPQLKASCLPLKDLCIFLWGGYGNGDFGMAEFTALTVWQDWMRRQSFRTSLDQVTKPRCNSHGKYDGDCGCLKDSWYSTSDGWRKRLRVDGKPSRKVCQNGCYRLASLWFWWAATSAWWTFKTSWKYFTFMFALGAGQIDPESTAGHAICDNSLGHQQKCLYNVR